MDTAQHAAAQARRPPPASHSRNYWLRLSLMKLYRRRNRHLGIADDDDGRMFLMIMFALGISNADANNLASWITTQEMRAIRKGAARFDPTPENIGLAINLTYAERKRHKAWKFPCCDKTPEEVARLDADARNKKKRADRADRNANIGTGFPPREAAVLAAIDRLAQRPGCNVTTIRDIIASIGAVGDRAAFPAKVTSFRVLVYRSIDRLERDGWVRKRRNLGCTFILMNSEKFVTAAPSYVPVRKSQPMNGLQRDLGCNTSRHGIRLG
jgi:hypothetical protein